MTSRRGFLLGAAALIASPAIVRAESLMKLAPRKLIVPEKLLWVPCDGRALLKKDYPELYAVIGDNYGIHPSAAHFQVPDAPYPRGFEMRIFTGRDHHRYSDPTPVLPVGSIQWTFPTGKMSDA